MFIVHFQKQTFMENVTNLLLIIVCMPILSEIFLFPEENFGRSGD